MFLPWSKTLPREATPTPMKPASLERELAPPLYLYIQQLLGAQQRPAPVRSGQTCRGRLGSPARPGPSRPHRWSDFGFGRRPPPLRLAEAQRRSRGGAARCSVGRDGPVNSWPAPRPRVFTRTQRQRRPAPELRLIHRPEQHPFPDRRTQSEPSVPPAVREGCLTCPNPACPSPARSPHCALPDLMGQ